MKTYNDLKVFEFIATNYLKRHETETKLGKRIGRSFEILRPIYINIANEEGDIRRDFCYCEKDIIIRDASGNYKYTKANEKKMMDAVRALKAKELEIDFSSCFILEPPIDLVESEINAFRGIVISDTMADEMIAKLD